MTSRQAREVELAVRAAQARLRERVRSIPASARHVIVVDGRPVVVVEVDELQAALIDPKV